MTIDHLIEISVIVIYIFICKAQVTLSDFCKLKNLIQNRLNPLVPKGSTFDE